MLIVLALISLLVVTASPTFVRLMRDRRVGRLASMFVDYMRTARTMAIGRGQPILLSWDKSKGYLTITEPVVQNLQISNNCATTTWGTGTQVYAGVSAQSGTYEGASAEFHYESSTASDGYICFTPSGRMFIRTSTSDAFALVSGVPYFSVVNTYTQATRTVYLMPNGTARLQL